MGYANWLPATKADIQGLGVKLDKFREEIKVTDAEFQAVLTKIDTTTTHTGDNVKVIADVTQEISDEMDAFIKAKPAGTVLTEADLKHLQAIADRTQAASNASDSQVDVLKAVAAKGKPVTPDPTPAPVL